MNQTIHLVQSPRPRKIHEDSFQITKQANGAQKARGISHYFKSLDSEP